MSNQGNSIPEPVKKPVKYNLPTLPEGFKKRFIIDQYGNTACFIYKKYDLKNAVSYGVTWLNEVDKPVYDREKGKAISYGRAWKNWKDKPTKKKPVYTASFTFTGLQSSQNTMSISGYDPKIKKLAK